MTLLKTRSVPSGGRLSSFLTDMSNPETASPTPENRPEAAPETGAAPDLAAQLAELQARHAEVSDAYLRAKAETENVRRRAEDDVAKARKFAIEAFAESLLPVLDSLQAATAIEGASAQQMSEGPA